MSTEPTPAHLSSNGRGFDPIGLIVLGAVVAFVGGFLSIGAGPWAAWGGVAIGGMIAQVGLIALAVSIGIRDARRR